MTKTPPVSASTSSPGADGIVAEMTDAIQEQRVQPGTKLREDELGEIFGVSRTLVRQALHRLQHNGLVGTQRNRGSFVARPTIKEAREIFEARVLLEPQTARSAAKRATATDLDCLERLIKDAQAALDRHEMGLALRLSGTFHLEIARIADQQTVETFLRQLVARSSLVMALYWHRRTSVYDSHAQHVLIRALRNRDGELAEERMKSCLLDMFSQLDLREREEPEVSLKQVLNRERHI